MENYKLVNFCEFDKYAIKSYCAIHKVSEKLNLGDITKVNENNLSEFNMICGGSPCQDFSVAGKQKGSVWTCKDCGHEYNPLTVHWSERDKCPECGSNNIEKTRSSLLVEYLRVIRANKPNFGMYENVKNIVGKQFKETTFKLFTDELKEYGYNVYWKVLNAKDYGIPQNRERVYLIFIKKELDNGKFKYPEAFDNGIRLKDILENEVDEKFYISTDKVKRFLTNMNTENALLHDSCQVKREGKAREYDDFCPTLTARDYKDPRLVNDNVVRQIGNIVNTGSWDNPQRGRIYSSNGCSPALNTCGGGGLEPKIVQVGNINPSGKGMNGNVFDENGGVKDFSYPDSKTRKDMMQDCKNISSTITATETNIYRIEYDNKVICASRGRNPGNPSDRTPKSPTEQRLEFNHKGCTNTLTSVQKDNYVFELDNIRIRKLTPRECFRLMGFSDSDFEAAQSVGISNSQLYKQAGNSIVVNVLYYILVELYKAMPYLFDDLKLSSFFSGIGAFEIALDKLYESINSGEFIVKQ